MSPLALSFYGLLALVSVAMSALYSGLETGVYTLNRVRLTVRSGRSERRAVRLRDELVDENRTLSTLLIGTNASSYVASYAVTALLHEFGLDDWRLIVVVAVVITPLLFVFGEVLPKDLFRTHTDHWTYNLSRLLTASRWLFVFTGLLPVIQLVANATSRLLGASGQGAVSARRRISQLIKEGVGTGVLSESQTTLVDRALAMRGRTVAREMIPWSHVVTVPVNAGRMQRDALIQRRNFTRMPVVDDEGRVVGILSSLDALLDPDQPTTALMTKPLSFPAGTPVRETLQTMRSLRQTMAIVSRSPQDRPQGLITIKDLVEPITGELGAW